MVGAEDRHGLLCEPAGLERRKHLTDPLVDVRQVRVVAVATRAHVVLRDVDLADPTVVPEPAAVRVELVDGPRGRGREVDVVVGVEIPVASPRDVRVVRVGERHAEEERDVTLVAGVVVEPADRVEGHLVVVLELVRHLGDAGLLDGAHVVVPPVDALARAAPVGRPAEVAGVDVRGEPLLEAVQLIRADEVHLAAEAGPVALEPEVVREGRDRRGKLRRVVVHAGPRRQRARHEHRAGRRAQRARAVRVLEHDSLLGEPVDRGRPRDAVAVGAEEERGQLVDHHEQDVGRPAHRRADATGSLTAFRGRRPSSTSRTDSAARR